MRIVTVSLLLAAVIGAAALASPAEARDRRYCFFQTNGSEDCSFDTMGQCRAAASGRFGTCNINRRFAFGQRHRPRHAH